MKTFKEHSALRGIEYHLDNNIPLAECVYRPHSEAFYEFYVEARKLYKEGKINPTNPFDVELLETDIGMHDIYEGQVVPLDIPMLEEDLGNIPDIQTLMSLAVAAKMSVVAVKAAFKTVKGLRKMQKVAQNAGIKLAKMTEEKDVELNKPKRGGPKKFYVYVKDGDKVKKVTFGDTSGLDVNFDDEEARKSFAARHQCHLKKDKTTPGYWSCNLPKYASELGLKNGGNFFW